MGVLRVARGAHRPGLDSAGIHRLCVVLEDKMLV